MVFIDTIDILVEYARLLNYPYISGELKHYEREKILQFFQHLSDDWNVLLLSRVGDVGIDLPDANVAIEVSSLFGSRRQEAQRLGRILRPKEKKHNESYQSYFYSLVSLGTEEMKYSFKRQKFLIEQGYNFKILNESDLPYNKNETEKKKFKMSTEEAQNKYLEYLLNMCFIKDSDKGKNRVVPEEEMKFSFKRKGETDKQIYIEK